MTEPVLRAKFLGALVGTAVGDGLGVPFEGRYQVSLQEIEAEAQRQEVLTYTDDTHMMIGVAESLLKSQGFDGEDMARIFIKNYELEPWRGYGPGPPRIFQRVKRGAAWDKAAGELYHGGSYGNGAAMRVAPVGVFYHSNPVRLKEVAARSSLITHAHNLGKEGAALQAGAIALATNLKPSAAFNRRDFLAGLTSYVTEGIYREKLGWIAKLLETPDKGRVITELGNGVEAFNSVPAAVYSFLSQPDSFARAVLYAISLGGDTDTIGAMTGAISGAYLGLGGIPAGWKNKLENRAYIEELADKLWAASRGLW